MSTDVGSVADQERIISDARNAVMYEDGDLKPLTPETLAIVNTALKTNQHEALFLKGLSMSHSSPDEALKWYRRAEAKGCRDPRLYYLLGELVLDNPDLSPESYKLAKTYFEQSIGCK